MSKRCFLIQLGLASFGENSDIFFKHSIPIYNSWHKVSERRQTNTFNDLKGQRLSPFVRELIDDLAVGHYRGQAWKRFLARAFSRSRENLAVSPPRTGAFVAWATLGAIVGIGLLLVRWLLTDAESLPVGHTIAWAGWYIIATTWGLLHLGLADTGENPGARRLGLPNGLSFVRLGLAPLIVALSPAGLVKTPDALPATLVAALVATDVLDGQLARAMGIVSRLGRVIDPLADVVSLTALALALFRVGALPLPLLGLVLFRFPGAFVIALGLFLARGPFRIRPTLLGRITVVLLYAVFLLSFVTHYRLIPLPPDEWVAWARWALCVPLTANIIYLAIHALRHLRS